jgi:DNA-binding protein H-NS
MKSRELKSMSVDELWSVHQMLVLVLTQKLSSEKVRLEGQLRQLRGAPAYHETGDARRPYPQVFPKYRNPAHPSETWAGRGKQPRWLTEQLQAGKKLEDFRIEPDPPRRRTRR